jgi:hypothetical protein
MTLPGSGKGHQDWCSFDPSKSSIKPDPFRAIAVPLK